MKLLGLVRGNEGYPLACWHILCYTKSTMQVRQIPVFQVQIPGVTASNAYHEKYTLLNNVKINFQLPSAVVHLNQVYSFICPPKPSLSALVEKVPRAHCRRRINIFN